MMHQYEDYHTLLWINIFTTSYKKNMRFFKNCMNFKVGWNSYTLS